MEILLLTGLTHEQQSQRGYYLLGWPTCSSYSEVVIHLADPRAAVTERLLLTWLTHEQQSQRGSYLLGWPRAAVTARLLFTWLTHMQQSLRGYYLLGWPTCSSHGEVTTYLADPRAAVTERLLLTWLTHGQQSRRGYYLLGWPAGSSHGEVFVSSTKNDHAGNLEQFPFLSFLFSQKHWAPRPRMKKNKNEEHIYILI